MASCTFISVEGSGELSNESGDFDSSHEDPLLSLQLDVLRPSDESGEISFG